MAASSQKVVSRNIYAGETRNNLRDGYGIYKYSNKFFQYEGEWVMGRKHGHGKLVMADGTYYEGEFHEGEITGHGFKRYASGQHYTGHFIEGEPTGHGIMTYCNGMVYEGEFHKNQRCGYGIMRAREPDTGVYEGYFHEDKRHGDGSQMYNNGERYDGEWVADKRHGHGEMIFGDGSVYKGQFRNDVIHGQGTIIHASGVVYEGIWLNNKPRFQPVQLVIVLDLDKANSVVQGDALDVKVECHDSEGNIVQLDKGREIRLSAGFKFIKPSDSQMSTVSRIGVSGQSESADSLDDLNFMSTPFGFPIVDYPINNCLNKEAMAEEVRKELDIPTSAGSQRSSRATTPVGSTPAVPETDPSVHIDSALLMAPTAALNPETNPLGGPTISAPMILESGEMFIAPPIATQRTEDGQCCWNNVKFSPPPVGYRPYQIIDAIKNKKSKKASSESVVDETEGIKKSQDPKPGDYVIMAHDVTDPPFMGTVLEPAFVVVTVLRKKKPPKKPKSNVDFSVAKPPIPESGWRKSPKKSKEIRRNPKAGSNIDWWDTRSHIAQSMARRPSVEEREAVALLGEEEEAEEE